MVVRETFNIDPSYAGLVIGKQGKDLRALKEIPGVNNINFDTKSSHKVHKLEVTASSKNACGAVFAEVQRRISSMKGFIPEVARTFIDVNDKSLDTIVLHSYGSRKSEAIVVGGRGGSNASDHYTITSFIQGSLSDAFDIRLQDGPKVNSNFMEFMERNVRASFQEALDNHKGMPGEKLDFHVSPGKIVFLGPRSGGNGVQLLRSKMTGSNGVSYLTGKRMKTFFTPNLVPTYVSKIAARLTKLDFENINEGNPENYTTVHLEVQGNKRTNFSVVLAVDENLNSHKTASDDPRLSEEKKMILHKVLSATTIGEVLGVTSATSKIKVQYFKMTRDVHPDKNLHPGATEGFKKLADAYEKLQANKPASTSALSVAVNIPANSDEKQPPKVVKVKTKKVRLCVVTTMSSKELDLRGSLIGFEEDKEKMTDEVRKAVNMCWDERDASGDIPVPSGNHKIHINCIKQVLEAHTWVKDIPFRHGGEETAILEVKIKKLREKAGRDRNWNECVEVDLKLNVDRSTLTGDFLSRELMEMKRQIDQIFS